MSSFGSRLARFGWLLFAAVGGRPSWEIERWWFRFTVRNPNQTKPPQTNDSFLWEGIGQDGAATSGTGGREGLKSVTPATTATTSSSSSSSSSASSSSRREDSESDEEGGAQEKGKDGGGEPPVPRAARAAVLG